jgi:hypothetical protein
MQSIKPDQDIWISPEDILAGEFFCQPQTKQINDCFLCAFDAQSVCRQAKDRHVGVEITRRKILVRDFFKQDAEVHCCKVSQFNETVNLAAAV